MFVHNFDGFYDKNKLDQVAFNCTLFEQNAKIMLYKYSIKKKLDCSNNDPNKACEVYG